LGVQRGEGLEGLREFSLPRAIEIPELSIFGVASLVERLIAGIPKRLMGFADGPRWNLTFGAITVALD